MIKSDFTLLECLQLLATPLELLKNCHLKAICRQSSVCSRVCKNLALGFWNVFVKSQISMYCKNLELIQGNKGEVCLPLTCQILTIFSMAEARYLPLRLQASEAKQCSPGEPREFNPSSEELSLTQQEQQRADTHKSKTFTAHWWTWRCSWKADTESVGKGC